MPSNFEEKPLGPGRMESEPARAFRAFCYFRDLGPSRSRIAAWHRFCAKRGRRLSAVPGSWNAMSVKWSWQERAAVYDAEVDATRRAVRLERLKATEERRAEFECDSQIKLENHFNQWSAQLDKASLLPVADVTQQKMVDGKPTVTKVKGINFASAARMLEQVRNTARDATLGFHVPAEKEEAAETASEVKGVTWMEATIGPGNNKK
jgi:hypothetical protein